MVEQNAIRRRICVASRIRSVEYSLSAHENLVVAPNHQLAVPVKLDCLKQSSYTASMKMGNEKGQNETFNIR